MLYPNASLQEITCLTAALSVWYGESIDYIAGENREYRSEEGLRLLPTKTAAQADPADYDCVILPGTIDPLPALYDEALIAFLRRGIGTNTVFAAISSAPLLLCKAGLLEGKKFTAGFSCRWPTFSHLWKRKTLSTKAWLRTETSSPVSVCFTGRLPKPFCTASALIPGKTLCARNRRILRRTPYWTEDEYREFLEEWKEYGK